MFALTRKPQEKKQPAAARQPRKVQRRFWLLAGFAVGRALVTIWHTQWVQEVLEDVFRGLLCKKCP